MNSDPSLIRFSIFTPFPELVCAFSTRIGGVSESPYDGQNMGLKTGDDPDNVLRNRKSFFSKLGISEKEIAFSDQIHGTKIAAVFKPGVYESCDALITNEPNTFLAIQTADCFPLFFYEPQQKAVAAVHAGWRGAISGIVPATLDLLVEKYRIQTEQLRVAIGPGLQKECFEVGEVVFKQVDEKFLTKHPDRQKRYFDLYGFLFDQLTEKNVLPDHIFDLNHCTKCLEQRYFSFRRDGKQSGRMIGLIGIRNTDNF